MIVLCPVLAIPSHLLICRLSDGTVEANNCARGLCARGVVVCKVHAAISDKFGRPEFARIRVVDPVRDAMKLFFSLLQTVSLKVAPHTLTMHSRT